MRSFIIRSLHNLMKENGQEVWHVERKEPRAGSLTIFAREMAKYVGRFCGSTGGRIEQGWH
jgi:hypothetical protein